ncbi:MFS transporter [Sphingomonas sp. RB1R13]|uniref:MFS transporter n=1 Tax=Sphingomonas sp. RB1R13 TaxID=3096159 RepID=UPI002FCC1045
MDASDLADQLTPRTSAANGWYGLGIIALASIVGSIVAKGVIPLISESLRISLRLTDQHLGLINGLALTFITAIATIPVGWLADKMDRRWLLSICVMIWSAGSVAFGLSTHFPALFVAAMAIGLGEAVLGPVTYSMIPDLFPRSKWVAVNSVFVATVLVGSYVGMGLAGTLLGFVTNNRGAVPAIVAGLEPWRIAMLVVATGGPLLALMLLFLRLERITLPGVPMATNRDVIDHFKTHARALTGIFFGFGVSYAAFGANGVWSPVIVQRVFGADPANIGQVLGYGSAVCSLVGVFMGVLLARRFRPRYGDQTALMIAQWALLGGLIVALFMPFAQTVTQYYTIVLVKLGLTFMATSLAPTVLQLIAPARMRGRVIAIGGMVTILFGSIMPLMVGTLSAAFAGPRGILNAMSAVVIPSFAVGLLFLWWGSKAVPATLRAVEVADAGEVSPTDGEPHETGAAEALQAG